MLIRQLVNWVVGGRWGWSLPGLCGRARDVVPRGAVSHGSFLSWVVQSQLGRSFICGYSCCQPKATCQEETPGLSGQYFSASCRAKLWKHWDGTSVTVGWRWGRWLGGVGGDGQQWPPAFASLNGIHKWELCSLKWLLLKIRKLCNLQTITRARHKQESSSSPEPLQPARATYLFLVRKVRAPCGLPQLCSFFCLQDQARTIRMKLLSCAPVSPRSCEDKILQR